MRTVDLDPDELGEATPDLVNREGQPPGSIAVPMPQASRYRAVATGPTGTGWPAKSASLAGLEAARIGVTIHRSS